MKQKIRYFDHKTNLYIFELIIEYIDFQFWSKYRISTLRTFQKKLSLIHNSKLLMI